MKRFSVLFFCIALIFTSCFFNEDVLVEGFADGSFSEPVSVIGTKELNDFTFFLMSDYHLGREDSTFPDLASWLASNGPFDFAVDLGDITDHGYQSEYDAYLLLKESFEDAMGNAPFFNIIGNHDMKQSRKDYNIWMENIGQKPYGYFICNGISFYFLDSHKRSLGAKQYRALEKALKRDDNPKVILSHYLLTSDQRAVFYFSLSDIDERDGLLRMMKENDVALWICGHWHKGNENLSFSDSCHQLNISSSHAMDSIFEGNAQWYVGRFVASERTLYFDCYEFNGRSVNLNRTISYKL